MTAISDAPVSTPLLIAGEEREGGDGAFPVEDPARRGAVVGYAASASAADAEAAIRAAEEAWPAWAALSAAERTAIVLKALDGLDADAGERADILSRENGKVRFEAAVDLQVFVGRFHQAAEFTPELDTPERIAGPPFNTTITKLPAGLVTIIYPFNWPLAILAASLPYALMAGNTVIVKPPPTAPLSSVRTLRHLVRGLPPGVLNVVTGADDILGPVVIGDPRIKHVCFTGSVGGGRLKIVAEEQFGPALPVIPYDSEAEAVVLANQTWSGLCSSVWSADTEHAMKIAGQLRTGVTFSNNHNATAVGVSR